MSTRSSVILGVNETISLSQNGTGNQVETKAMRSSAPQIDMIDLRRHHSQRRSDDGMLKSRMMSRVSYQFFNQVCMRICAENVQVDRQRSPSVDIGYFNRVK